jgi:ABC-type transport system involved in cytochrome bd biosynthesis fused ATPase/permease subunit
LLLADWTFGDAFLTLLSIFFFVVYIWILFTIIGDLFRDHQLSGWAKAGWILVLLILPYLGAFIYLIARGQGMRDRAIKEQADMRKQMDAYVRETAGTSSADELAKLSDLHAKGTLSDAEFEKAKAKLLS